MQGMYAHKATPTDCTPDQSDAQRPGEELWTAGVKLCVCERGLTSNNIIIAVIAAG